jgi:cobalt-zinc-cadmium efflux system outer membrane protein
MLQVSEEILNTATEAKRAYIGYSALSLIRDEMERIKDHVEEWKDHLIYRQKFGYASDLDIYMANALVIETEVEFAKIESDLLISRYRLNRVLGLSHEQFYYEIIEALSEEINQLPDLEQLISDALLNRPDVQAARLHVENARHVLALERSRIFSNVESGAVYERGIEGDESIGPEIGVQLPIFDQNQAQIAKAEYRLRQTEKELRAKIEEVREDISVVLERLSLLSQQINVIKTQSLPAYTLAVEHAEKYFNAMQLNMLCLLDAQRKLLETKRHYFNTLKEYVVFFAAEKAEKFSALSKKLKEYVNFPTSIAVDKRGIIYLLDQNGGVIVILGAEGDFKGHQLSSGWKEGLLQYPSDLCINEKGNLFIVDRNNSRVQVFTSSK